MAPASPAQFKTIDFGAHLHPVAPETVGFEAENPNEGIHSFIEEAEGQPLHRDVAAVADRYRSSGIDGAVLSQPLYMGYHRVDHVENANDALLDAISGYDDFYGLAAIPTAGGGANAAREFERALANGYNGGALETKTDGIELHHPEVEPVFEVADRTGAPLLVHPKLDESLHPDVLDDRWQLNAIFGREAALCESICKVIHEGVLEAYPNLNLVYHHTGGNIASMLGRVRLQLDKDRWPGLGDLKSYDEFKAQLEDRIYLDSSGYYGDHRAFQTTLAEFPATQFLFGTDFPYETRSPAVFQTLVTSIADVCSRRDARRILGGNAIDLLVNI